MTSSGYSGCMTKPNSQYTAIPASEVPGDLVWIIPRRNQGQIVEVAYSNGVPDGRSVNYDADEGARYKRVTDRSDRSVIYYRLAI